MKTFRHLAFFSLLVLLLAAAAQAEGKHPRGPQDLNDDGQISRAEFDVWADTLFTSLDADGDQMISEEEKPERRGRRGRGGPPPGLAGHALLNGADANDDDSVDGGEWQAFLATLEVDDNGALTADSLQSLLPRRPDAEEGEAAHPRRGHIAGRLFDSDRDGTVTVADLEDLFAALDSNTDGTLSQDELPTRGPGRRGPGRRGPGGRGTGGDAGEGRFGS